MSAVLDDEAGRLAALRRYDLPDLPPEPELEAVLRVAAIVCGVGTASLNLLDSALQCQYVTAGFEGGLSPRSDSMCDITVTTATGQHVPDTLEDTRFATNPYVDGRYAAVRFYASSPLVTPDGYVLGSLCVMDFVPGSLTDSQRGALQDLAGQVMALLERRRLTRQAEEATRAKSAFLAAVSHEIRTPMNGVLGMLALLLASPLEEEQRGHAELARRSAETLLGLLDDVLDLSKGEAGHVVLAAKAFDPAALVDDVTSMLRPLATARGTTLVARQGPDVPARLVGDAGRLRQVLVNLVGNALKFTPQGGVEVRTSWVEPAAGDVPRLSLEVVDTGEGMSQEEVANLFQPYQQGTSGRRHGGTGLGLVITAELVELMGGTLTCASELGVGTTFRLSLPLPELTTPERTDLDGLRVLVVDDGEVNRLVGAGLLESLGAVVATVPDGEGALDAVASAAYDVVLLDRDLPGLSGPQTAVRLRESHPGVALVGCTGSTSVQARQECLATGMVDVLVKPLRPEDLLRVLGPLV